MKLYIKNGKYWMLQWGFPVCFSVGIHIDKRFHYVDFHLIFCILTLGNPHWPYEDYRAWWASRSIVYANKQ